MEEEPPPKLTITKEGAIKLDDLRAKPIFKPEVQLKKSRKRSFNEDSLQALYSFGYQSNWTNNICVMEPDILILIAGNYLVFYQVHSMQQSFMFSVYGKGFTHVEPHPSKEYFAASEKSKNFSIHIFTFPELEESRILKNELAVMPCSLFQFHPDGELLVTISDEPENRLSIWFWKSEHVFYNEVFQTPILDICFSLKYRNHFTTSGAGQARFWSIESIEDEDGQTVEVKVGHRDINMDDKSKRCIYNTVDLTSSTYLSGTDDGHLFLWELESEEMFQSVRFGLEGSFPCHSGGIFRIFHTKKYVITLGSDGKIKFWNLEDFAEKLRQLNEKKLSLDEVIEDEEENGEQLEVETKEHHESHKAHLDCLDEISLSEKSELVNAVFLIIKGENKEKNMLIYVQDKIGCLWKVNVSHDLSEKTFEKIMNGPGSNFTDMDVCRGYPLAAVTSKNGSVLLYDLMEEVLVSINQYSAGANCVVWPGKKFDHSGSSIIVGFEDGHFRCLSITQETLEGENLQLQFVIKPHTDSVQCFAINDSCTTLVSQGLDHKLYFLRIEKMKLVPLGYYMNIHDVCQLHWIKHSSAASSESEAEADAQVEETESVLIICKQSYILKVDPPDHEEAVKENKESFLIECNKCQVYKVTCMEPYQKLGDRIEDSDCEECAELSQDAKTVLNKAKYDEKRERRLNRHKEIGLGNPLNPPEVLCCLESTDYDHYWLSLGKEDFGYLYEFDFIESNNHDPINLVPNAALEILTCELISVFSLCYSPCGKFIFMGQHDGGITVCRLSEAYNPASGYDFVKYVVHDADMGPLKKVRLSSDGRIIITAGGDGNIMSLRFGVSRYATEAKPKKMPFLRKPKKLEDVDKEHSVEEEHLLNIGEIWDGQKAPLLRIVDDLMLEYVQLKKNYDTYFKKLHVSMGDSVCVPADFKIEEKVTSVFSKAEEVFYEETTRLLEDVDLEFELDTKKARLHRKKLHKYFKAQIEQGVQVVVHPDDQRVVKNFRMYRLPEKFKKYDESFSPELEYHYEEQQQVLKTLGKKTDEQRKAENEMANTKKAIIKYPEAMPITEAMLKFNRRKVENIHRLEKHIAEFEAYRKIVHNKEAIIDSAQEIERNYFKFKSSVELNDMSRESKLTFHDKRESAMAYFKKIHDATSFYNEHFAALKRMSEELLSKDSVDVKRTAGDDDVPDEKLKMYGWSCHLFGYTGVKNMLRRDEKLMMSKSKEDDELQNARRKEHFNSFFHFMSIARLKMVCEKKFRDIRFCVLCTELDIFKDTLKKERKCVRGIREHEIQLSLEEKNLKELEEEVGSLRNKRQEEKRAWLALYHELQDAIGRKNRHKGYFKEVFKKKIFDDEKKIHRRNPSSESSNSEQDIGSDDDCPVVDQREVDHDVLQKVMGYRLHRQEVERRMKFFKRKIQVVESKLVYAHRKIQQLKDQLSLLVSDINTIPIVRKGRIARCEWPIMLNSDCVHSEFIAKMKTLSDVQKMPKARELLQVYESVTIKLTLTNDLVENVLDRLTEMAVARDLSDFIDIAKILNVIHAKIEEQTILYIEELTLEMEIKEIERTKGIPKDSNVFDVLLDDVNEEQLDTQNKVSDQVQNTEKRQAQDKTEANSSTMFRSDFMADLMQWANIKNVYTRDTEIKTKTAHISWRDIEEEGADSTLQKWASDRNLNGDKVIANAVTYEDFSRVLYGKHLFQPSYYIHPMGIRSNKDKNNVLKTFVLDLMSLTQDLLVDEDIWVITENIVNTVTYNIECDIEAENRIVEKDTVVLFHADATVNFGGGLNITKAVLQHMEKRDNKHFPYSSFYKAVDLSQMEVEEDFVAHVESSEHFFYEKETQEFEEMTRKVSDFIAVDCNDILVVLKSYYRLKESIENLMLKKRDLLKKNVEIKNSLRWKKQELVQVDRKLKNEMLTKFKCILNVDQLEDAIENPFYLIKKFESESKLEPLKKDLKRIKESEVEIVKLHDKLRFEDTRICYQLLALKEDVNFWTKCYTDKRSVLPKISNEKSAEMKSEGTDEAENRGSE